jgi:hypothetical protein
MSLSGLAMNVTAPTHIARWHEMAGLLCHRDYKINTGYATLVDPRRPDRQVFDSQPLRQPKLY